MSAPITKQGPSETAEIASFLLSLKHNDDNERPVTPDASAASSLCHSSSPAVVSETSNNNNVTVSSSSNRSSHNNTPITADRLYNDPIRRPSLPPLPPSVHHSPAHHHCPPPHHYPPMTSYKTAPHHHHPSPPHHYPHYSHYPYPRPPPSMYMEHCAPHHQHQHHHYPSPVPQNHLHHHHHHSPVPATIEESPASTVRSPNRPANLSSHGSAPGSVEVPTLLGGSKIVLEKDRDLVPDALFVAMAQMKPCRLTEHDRVGCYKTREIGFVGMCCKHCGGQPGFGRFYPNSVRSLAQTTTSQTILKHIGSKCRFCPANIRNAVLELQDQQAEREGMTTGRPRYGSRKIFFQRVWTRLHGSSKTGLIVDDDTKLLCRDDVASLGTPSDVDEETSMSSYHSGNNNNNVLLEPTKRKMHFDNFAIKASKKIRQTYV